MKNGFLIWITKRKLVPFRKTKQMNTVMRRRNDPSKYEAHRRRRRLRRNIPGLSISLMVSKQCSVIGIHCCEDWHIGGRGLDKHKDTFDVLLTFNRYENGVSGRCYFFVDELLRALEWPLNILDSGVHCYRNKLAYVAYDYVNAKLL